MKDNKDKMSDHYTKLLSWKDMTPAGIIFEAGSSVHYETGSWRTMRPIRDMEKCISCMKCWFYCPDSSVLVEGTQMLAEYDLDHCKGCGLCAEVCPDKVKAIKLVAESEFRK